MALVEYELQPGEPVSQESPSADCELQPRFLPKQPKSTPMVLVRWFGL